MSIFRIIGMTAERQSVTRYIRAASYRAAQLRAFKAFALRTAAIGIASRQMAMADVGTVGYDEACNETETRADTGAQLRAMQSHSGADNTGRNMYMPAHAAQIKTAAKAMATAARLGLI